MNKLLFVTVFVFCFCVNGFAQFCDELRSYNKVWTLQARKREETREARENYRKTLSREQLERISDLETYPTDIMKCGMGFSNGLAKVFVNGKAGFIDFRGRLIIKAKFKDVGRFSENLAPVQLENGKWGYVNKKGVVVIKPKFDWALIFREGLALVQIKEKWGFINTKGEIIIKPMFAHANSFSENLAHVQLYREKYYSGYINKQGQWVIKPIYNGGDNFNKGQAVVDQDVKDEKGNYKYTECYLIDNKGNKLGETECSRTINSPKLIDSTKIDFFFDDYKTGYRTASGKIIWKPTK